MKLEVKILNGNRNKRKKAKKFTFTVDKNRKYSHVNVSNMLFLSDTLKIISSWSSFIFTEFFF